MTSSVIITVNSTPIANSAYSVPQHDGAVDRSPAGAAHAPAGPPCGGRSCRRPAVPGDRVARSAMWSIAMASLVSPWQSRRNAWSIARRGARSASAAGPDAASQSYSPGDSSSVLPSRVMKVEQVARRAGAVALDVDAPGSRPRAGTARPARLQPRRALREVADAFVTGERPSTGLFERRRLGVKQSTTASTSQRSSEVA